MNNKNKHGEYRYLLKNMGILTLSSFATKLLSFFLVPLYTSVLSTQEYGTYDLFNTTISLLIPILTIDIQESVLRFALDKYSNKKSVLSIGIQYWAISTVLVITAVFINCTIGISSVLKIYSTQFVFMYMTVCLSGILAYYARGIERVTDLSASSIVSALVTITSNILFLVVYRKGLEGYFLATILGAGSQILYLTIRLHAWDSLSFRLKRHDELRKQMSRYSIPMIANAVSWWVNNASDRYVVTWLCGIAANGIYSVGYKIPSIINILQSIFGQAWTISAVKDFDPDDKTHFFINVYNVYNFVLIISVSILIVLNKPIAKILFANDFYEAWVYGPFLMISIVFSGMSTFIGGLLSAVKQSGQFAKTSVLAAVINTFGNILLVLCLGPIGAAISTAISYFVMWALRLRMIKRIINLRVNLMRDLLSYLVLLIQATLLITYRVEVIINIYQILFVVLLLALYKKECIQFIYRIKKTK